MKATLFGLALALLLGVAVALIPQPSLDPSTLTIDACNLDEPAEAIWSIDSKSRVTLTSPLQTNGPLIVIDKCPSGAGGDLMIQFSREVVFGLSSFDRDGAIRLSITADAEEDLEGRIAQAGWVSLTSYQPTFQNVTNGEPSTVFKLPDLGSIYNSCFGTTTFAPHHYCSGFLNVEYNPTSKDTIATFVSRSANQCIPQVVAVFCKMATDLKCTAAKVVQLSMVNPVVNLAFAEISISATGIPIFAGQSTIGTAAHTFLCTTSDCAALSHQAYLSSNHANVQIVAHTTTDYSVISASGIAAENGAIRKAYEPPSGSGLAGDNIIVWDAPNTPATPNAFVYLQSECCSRINAAMSTSQVTVGGNFYIAAGVGRVTTDIDNRILVLYCESTPIAAAKYTCDAQKPGFNGYVYLPNPVNKISETAVLGDINTHNIDKVRSVVLTVNGQPRLFIVALVRVIDRIGNDRNWIRSDYAYTSFLCADVTCSTYTITQITDSDFLTNAEWEDFPLSRNIAGASIQPHSQRAGANDDGPQDSPRGAILDVTVNPKTGFASILVGGYSSVPIFYNCLDAACATAQVTVSHDALVGHHGDAGIAVGATDATTISAAMWGENKQPIVERWTNAELSPNGVRCDTSNVGTSVSVNGQVTICTRLPKRLFEQRLVNNGPLPIFFAPGVTQTTTYSWVPLGGRLRINLPDNSPVCRPESCLF